MATVDSLDIQISASVNKANASLTTLINRLDRVSASLSGVNSRGLETMGSGINKLSNAMSNFNANTKTADFSRLARNLNTISTVDTSGFSKLAGGISSISSSLVKLPDMGKSADQLGTFAKGISQLGYKSATQAIENIPKLSTAMNQLMTELSKAPKVSQNLIDMTNALAKLSRTGSSSGKAAASLAKSLDTYTASTSRASKGTFSLSGAMTKLYSVYFLVTRAFDALGSSIQIASNLEEVQNVVNATFGEYKNLIEDMSKTSITDFGMSELTTKQIASRFQAMGTSMGFAQGEMADMSIELTKLTADMASFYNVEQDVMATSLQSIFTGETEPLRKYGLSLDQATVSEWAMTQGLRVNMQTMTQAEKAMLRYQYVMANTSAAQGDFARTSQSWSNQIRVLRQNFEALGSVVGKTLINALKPLVQSLNNAMSHIISFADAVSNALGKIFGWKFQVGGGGVTSDLETGAGAAEDIAGGMSDAATAAKKMKSYLLGIDELNIISPEEADTGGVAGGGIGGLGTGAGADGGQWVETESIWESFESEIDTLYELGEYIRDALIGAMESIDWNAVYEKARGFGKGLAEFLNGLLAYDGEGRTLFGTVGKTLANTLNTVIYSALEFAKEFDFYQFGVNLADGINEFFRNFDFEAAGVTLNEWVDGLKGTIRGFVEKLSWKDIISGINNFLGTLELDTVAVLIGSFWFKNTIPNIAKLLKNAFVAKFSFATNPINLPSILVSIGKITLTSPGAIGELGIVLSNILNGSFLDPREWDNWFGELAIKINEGINSFIDDVIGPAILGVFEGIAQILTGTFNWDATLELLGSAKEKLSNAFNSAWIEGEGIFGNDIGKNIVEGIVEGFLGAIGIIVEPIGDFFVGFWDAICDAFGIHSPAETMLPIGENILLGVVEGFTSAIGNFWDAIEQWASKTITSFSEKCIEIKDSVVSWFLELPGNIYDAIIGVIEKISEWKDNVISYLSGKIPEIIDSVVEFFSELPEKLVQIGKDAISGLWEGIQSAWSELKSKVSEFCSEFVQGFKDALDIHSPSRKMEEIGKFAKEGLFAPFYNADENGVISGFANSIITLLQGYLGEGSNIFAGISTSLKTTWEETSIWWLAEIQRWLNDDVKAWFNAEDWKVTYSTIKTALESTWDEILSWWRNAIYRWYNDDVKIWFVKEKWIFPGIKDGLAESFTQAFESCNQLIDNFIKETKNKFDNMIKDLNAQMTTISNMSVSTANVSVMAMSLDYGDIPQYAVGGFPEDGLFFANRTELVGQFSNGRTAVANNEMIVAGIEEAAYRGFARAYAENNREASLLEELIVAVREGKTIEIDGRELVSAVDQRRARNGYAF